MADEMKPPAVAVEGGTPVKTISGAELLVLGQELNSLFTQYSSDRRMTELKWLRNLRQYLGVYDPEIESKLPANSSRAYPRVTRAKCISVLSRIMNLMFQGNERNWEINASPSADMAPEDVAAAVEELTAQRQEKGVKIEVNEEFIDSAIQRLADTRSRALSKLIDDQMQEIGGDQTLDYVALNRKVAHSGIMYGLGVLRGPFVRKVTQAGWGVNSEGQFEPTVRDIYKPQYDFLPVWDVYPDMTSRTLPGEGYFTRLVMGRRDLRKLADREDFMADQIKKYLAMNTQGNYRAREFETDLRSMGTKNEVSDQKQDPQGKYEIIIWNGPVSANRLEQAGVDVPEANKADDLEAEVWMVDSHVIKADINPWRKMNCDVKTIHFFQFDEDDTSPIGNGLPNVIRDSQMSVCASTRMTLDNASVTCGPNLEVNMDLVRQDQDLTSIEPYKIWYREGTGAEAQYPAVKKIEIDGHLAELQKLTEMFMAFADMESFVGPATGGDMSQTPSEPMRTAAGASMLRGDAALPFKDIVRNFDSFTQSVIQSLVQFNRKFNPALAPAGDYNVIARGATSLIAKEVRGMQLDVLATTLTPEERDHIDERKFIEQRFAVRDMMSLLVPAEEAAQNKAQRAQTMAEQAKTALELAMAEVRKTQAEAFKNITQGQKNSASADAATANTALEILDKGLHDHDGNAEGAGTATRQ